MPLRILVLHGPTLSLAREGTRTLTQLDAELVARAAALDAEVKCHQANGEAGLLDELVRHADWCDAVIINPASLAPLAYGLADALLLLKKPAVEVQLGHEVPGRGRSALKGVVDKQLHGRGFAGYVTALESLCGQVKAGVAAKSVGRAEAKRAHVAQAEARRAQKSIGRKGNTTMERDLPGAAAAGEAAGPERGRGKTIGRKAPTTQGAPSGASGGKTIGRGTPEARGPEQGARMTTGITRALVRERLALRLSGRESPDAFAAWARTQYLAVQGGAPCEAGQKDHLEDVLMLLAASARASDELLLSTMAKLDV